MIRYKNLLTIIFIASTLIGGPALASKSAASSQTTNTGNDISYPQCYKAFPSGQAFGIVGANNGLANNTNPCLAVQLTWAAKSTGTTAQVKSQLYVNTANPGGLGTTSWPSNNIDPSGNVAPNAYGTCDNSDSLPCAWQYGWNRSVEDVVQRFTPAAQSAGLSSSASAYPWWLDVETANTWKSGSTFAIQSNAADLEGMVAYFSSIGAKVGIYSTSYQWGTIAGTVSSTSNLNGVPSWIPGATSLNAAKSNCFLAPLTPGGKVSLTQFTSRTFDYDYSCI